MKRINFSILLVFALLLGVGLLAGCGGSEPEDKPTAGLSGSITVAGSTSVQPFSEVLAEEFMVQNPQTQINIQGGGSSQGIEAAASGIADIGASSRELKAEESNLKQNVIAKDGIAVIVHPANTVRDLSLAQLKDIFTGKTTNWKELGGADLAINLVSREAGSGTRDGFESLVMNKEPVTDKALVGNSTGAVKTMIAGDKAAIGYISLAAIDDTIQTAKVEGVEPSIANVSNGSYKISRPFIYVTKDEPMGLAKEFIKFALSIEGQALLAGEGAVPVR